VFGATLGGSVIVKIDFNIDRHRKNCRQLVRVYRFCSSTGSPSGAMNFQHAFGRHSTMARLISTVFSGHRSRAPRRTMSSSLSLPLVNEGERRKVHSATFLVLLPLSRYKRANLRQASYPLIHEQPRTSCAT